MTTELRDASEFWPEWDKCGKSDTEFGHKHGIPRTTVRDWRDNLENGLVWLYGAWREPGDTTEVVPIDPVAKEVEKLKRDAERKEHKVYTQEAARTEILIDHLTRAVTALPAVTVKPPYFISANKRRSPMSLVAHLSDFQYGEVVDPEQVMGLNAYDTEIAARRLFHLETLILTALDIIGRAHPLPRLRLLILGDMVSGIIHNELVETNEFNIYEQWANLSLLLSQFVMRLAARFDEVTVEGVPGNHGRITMKPPSKNRYVNWDYMMYQTMSLMLANQPNVKCVFPRSPLMTTEIEGHSYLLFHGDEVKSYQGIPWYGIERAISKLRELLQAKNIMFEYAALGHMHNWAELERAVGQVLVNGSLVGGSEYGIGRLLSTVPPTQALYAVHPEHGKTWELRNSLNRGDDIPHPYILPTGDDCLADSYKKVISC